MHDCWWLCIKVPPLNFNSTDYLDLINQNGCRVTVPPILSDLSEEQLKSLVSGHSPPVTELESFPFHTQSVERCVKIVAEAAAARCLWSRQQRWFYSSTITIARTDANYLKPKKDYCGHSKWQWLAETCKDLVNEYLMRVHASLWDNCLTFIT